MTSKYVSKDSDRDRLISYCDSMSEILIDISNALMFHEAAKDQAARNVLNMKVVRLARDAQADWQLLAPMLTDVIERANG